ncbi:ABC transporter permease subunit [Actinospica sp.]|uniref:ABC transporter permease subunit n=1 Tax=Actinospica sp. TaxID=1872142 RepID=UPI002BF0E947|nr:ABC transporter permease subunit [Actinospica sp.]HWG25185.1 ABC transporter permease subunit [Actinospica sp.]
MSATTTRAFRLEGPARRITFAEAMDSEFAKIRSVRSTYWTLLICLVVSVGISLLIAAVTSANWDTISQSDRATTGMSTVVTGVFFGVLVTGVLGVMVVSTEYGTGMMRTSLTAFPRRATLFLAKASVLAIVVLLLGIVIAFASYAVASPFFTKHGVDLSLSQAANLRALLAVPVYLTLVALMGLGLGFLLRHTAGAISSLVGLFFVLPIITNFLPGTTGKDINKIVPSNAGSAMMATHATTSNGAPELSPAGGLVALLIWTAVLLVPAFWAFRHRDA